MLQTRGSDNYYFILDKLFRWTFKYRVAKNFPVDIYFLVDPSYTMRNLRTQLADLADDIGLYNHLLVIKKIVKNTSNNIKKHGVDLHCRYIQYFLVSYD